MTTHALLLTDVVESTRLAERLGDGRMAELWAAHDRVARDLLAAHRGREIDKSDGFLFLFERADDAAAYAVAYHRAIAPLGLKARAGLHVGPIQLRENAPADVARGAKPLEVEGLAKPTAARIMSIALGGQTLLSVEAREALGHTALRLMSHGHWRMKGTSVPIELFEIGDDEAPFTPPPTAAKAYRVVRDDDVWRPAEDIPHSLPSERDAFVGRHAELLDLALRFEEGARLVSVLGVGGTGKTRFVTRFGRTWLGEFPGGAWFCDLSEARDASGVIQAVAHALGVPLGREDPVVQVGHAIAGRDRCLVILDNFEQVARHARETLGRWLDRTTEARFVVTTREVLGLRGEAILALAPLATPEAVDLFDARARAASSSWVLTDAARSEVEELVRLLDELPLAVELAAARVRMMPPKAILARMGERFRLLASLSGRRDRQATLRSTIDWSWNLLSPADQTALAQLSAFEGGFALDAAEAVLDLSAHEDAPWPVDAVCSLLDKSLVRKVSDERFDMLVSVQAYAEERAIEMGVLDAAQDRHAAWFAALGTLEAIERLYGHDGVQCFHALARDFDNLTTACRRATARASWEQAACCLAAASEIGVVTGTANAVLKLASPILESPGVPADARARTLRQRAQALRTLGQSHEARTSAVEAMRLSEESGDLGGVAVAAGQVGAIAHEVGDVVAAADHFERALGLQKALGRQRRLADTLMSLVVVKADNDPEAPVGEALQIHRAIGNKRGEAHVLGHMARIAFNVGRFDVARSHLEHCLAAWQAFSPQAGAGALLGLGLIDWLEGRLPEAEATFRQVLQVERVAGRRTGEAAALQFLGIVRADMGCLGEAIELYGKSLALAREARVASLIGNTLSKLGLALAMNGELDRAEAAFSEGEAVLRPIGDAMLLAVLHAERAFASCLRGDRRTAAAQLAEACECADALGASPASELGRAITRARDALEARAQPG